MRTIAEIHVLPSLDLWLDIRVDPPGLALRRQGGGLVRIERAEIRHLAAVLYDVGADLTAGVERYVEIANSDGTLFVDSTLDPPGLVIWRTTAGLVRIEPAEVSDLIQALALAALELQALKAETGDARTDAERDDDDRRDYLEWLHGTPDGPAC